MPATWVFETAVLVLLTLRLKKEADAIGAARRRCRRRGSPLRAANSTLRVRHALLAARGRIDGTNAGGIG